MGKQLGTTGTTRSEQRARSRQRIIDAAVEVFSEFGYEAGSTRDIAARASVNQGLVTYHFAAKYELWQAAVNQVFASAHATQAQRRLATTVNDARTTARIAIGEYVRLTAAHPEMFRLLVAEGKSDSARMAWLVDTHLQPLYASLSKIGTALGFDESFHPHAFYTLIGAASVIFAVAPECRQLTGLNPATASAINRHAEFVANLLVPPLDPSR
jgi:TetR/AcrR family transcriptional regulator